MILSLQTMDQSSRTMASVPQGHYDVDKMADRGGEEAGRHQTDAWLPKSRECIYSKWTENILILHLLHIIIIQMHFRLYLRNRSALAVNCCVIIYCLEVSCKEDQIASVQGEWFIFVQLTGMGMFRVDQDLLIEHWHMMYIMLMLSWLKLSSNIVKLNIYHIISINWQLLLGILWI